MGFGALGLADKPAPAAVAGTSETSSPKEETPADDGMSGPEMNDSVKDEGNIALRKKKARKKAQEAALKET